MGKAFFLFRYVQGVSRTLFAFGSEFESAAAHKQGKHQYQATRVDIEVEVAHFTAAAAQKQDYE